MSSSNTVQKSRAEILSEIDAFVDASIDKMDSDQLKQFNRKSDKIMSRRMKKAAETRETSQLPLEVPRA